MRVQHPLVIDPDAEPEPDIAVVAGEPRAHIGAHPRSAVLVVEVAGSSLAFDRRDKALLYARASIPEYWIVNLADRVVEVHREPGAQGYDKIVRLESHEEITPMGTPTAGAAVAIASLLP